MRSITWFKFFFIMMIASCGPHTKPVMEYMPNMMDQPSIKAQEAPMRLPVADTVPRGWKPYPYSVDQGDLAGKELANPVARTHDEFIKGQKAFTTFCLPCHGVRGQGDGPIVPKFPPPPSLTSEKIMNWADGQIFHTMTMGQNLMSSYASQVPPEKRWAIVHYIRALQRSEHPRPDDIEQLKAKLRAQ